MAEKTKACGFFKVDLPEALENTVVDTNVVQTNDKSKKNNNGANQQQHKETINKQQSQLKLLEELHLQPVDAHSSGGIVELVNTIMQVYGTTIETVAKICIAEQQAKEQLSAAQEKFVKELEANHNKLSQKLPKNCAQQ